MIAADLPGYLEKYGDFLIESLGASSKPLWEAGGKVPDIGLLRAPMPDQWDRCMAIAKAWDHARPGDILSADMGTGKTLMAAVAVHVHAKGKPYRAIVVCPPHLTKKWVRELEITLPGIKTRIVSKYSEVLEIKGKPTSPEWWIMSGNKAKMSTTWRASFVKKRTGFIHCPNCDLVQMRKMREEGADILVPCTPEFLGKKRTTCECGAALYQWENTFDRWPVASIVQKQRRHAFKYLVIDEAHETKGMLTAIGLSIGKLASTIPYSVGLTGTLLNGYADSVFPLMWRLAPKKMAKLGIKWGDTMEFTKRFGRLETIINFKDKQSYANRQSKGGGKTTSVRVRPGIVPSLYGDCLMDNSVFCSLPDLGYKLPGFAEFLEPIEMDAEVADCYEHLESEIQSNIKQLLRMGSMGALSAMLNTLNGWPDHPYGFGEVGYKNEEGHWRTVAIPPELDQSVIRPKERRLIEICKDIASRGRQAWVYAEMTGKHDVIERLQRLLEKAGLRVKVLRANTAKPCDREEWIYKHGKDVDVILSNPALVRTGLDLFDRGGNHNFSSLVFYQTGYKLDTIRQAAKRAWRIGQTLDCEVFYLFYAATMQESVMKLMSAKTQAAQAVEGKFSSAGLAAMAGGDGDSAAMMLAKMLVDKKSSDSVRISAIEKQVRRIMAPVEEVIAVVREPAPVSGSAPVPVQSPVPVPVLIPVHEPVVEAPVVEVRVVKVVKPVAVVEETAASTIAIEKRRLKQWTDHADVIRTALRNGDANGPPMLRRFGKSLARLADGEREAMTSAVRFEELEQHLLQEVS